MSEKLHEFVISSILSSRTKQGMVNIHIDGKQVAQFDVAKAKTVSRMLVEATESAVMDEVLYKWLTTKLDFSDEKATYVLMEFRELKQGSKDTVFEM